MPQTEYAPDVIFALQEHMGEEFSLCAVRPRWLGPMEENAEERARRFALGLDDMTLNMAYGEGGNQITDTAHFERDGRVVAKYTLNMPPRPPRSSMELRFRAFAIANSDGVLHVQIWCGARTSASPEQFQRMDVVLDSLSFK